jgi:hypothetical protein
VTWQRRVFELVCAGGTLMPVIGCGNGPIVNRAPDAALHSHSLLCSGDSECGPNAAIRSDASTGADADAALGNKASHHAIDASLPGD